MSHILTLYEVCQDLRIREIALLTLLQKKGVATSDEIKAQVDEMRAAIAVDMIFDPEFIETEKKVKRMLEERDRD
jgi:hypothetical protein